jgi:beta-mannosidase
LKVDVVNDRLEKINAELKLKLMNFEGKVIWENASLVKIPANAGKNIFEINKNEFFAEYNNQLDQSVLFSNWFKLARFCQKIRSVLNLLKN